MGRLKPETLERVDAFADRMLDVTTALAAAKCPFRVIDQIAGCGTSVGANCSEADEALSRADFAKTIGIVIKEVNECRFWLRLCIRRAWIPQPRLSPLLEEAEELKRLFGAILTRTRRAAKAART